VYLSPKTTSLTVEVDIAPNIIPHPALNSWLKGMIKETAGKRVEIRTETDPDIPSKNQYTYTELMTLAKKTRDPLLAAQDNYLHILYVPRCQNAPTNAGLVLTATDLFIFQDVINGLSETPSVRALIERSTLMHEWGHLLGLDHLRQDNCIMSETVEVYGNRPFQDVNIPTAHCSDTLFQLDQIKKEAR
jgi:hypothetical protein